MVLIVIILHPMLTSHVAYSKVGLTPVLLSLIARSDLVISAIPPPFQPCLLCVEILYGSLFSGVICDYCKSD